jgi:hypothetical protein
VCFHFQRFCNCPAVVEAERIVAAAEVSEWLHPGTVNLTGFMDVGIFRAPMIPPDHIKRIVQRWIDQNDDWS